MSKIFSPWSFVALMVLASGILMWGPAHQDSAIMDELAHIPAGYSYVKYFDYRLNPEHPPLVKMLAGLPLLFKNYNFPLDKTSWTTDINGQWTAGTQFLYEEGNNADEILFFSRLGPILLTLTLIVFTYIFAKEIIGRWWALLPAFFIAFSPNILAHGHYVTTDIGAALGMLLAIYYFLKYLFESTNKNLVWAGIAFGIAQLVKFSAVLLVPYFFLVLITFAFIKNRFWKKIFAAIGIFAIGLLLIYALYLLVTWNYPIGKQVTDTEFILQSFGFRPAANLDIWMSGNKILRPLAHYLLGVLMVIQRSAGGNTSYFLGEVSSAGWWYYFPTVFVMKESLPILIIIALTLWFNLFNIINGFKGGVRNALNKFKEYLYTHFTEFSLLIFIILYWSYSIQSNLNIGFRHLIPTLPFIYTLSASAIKRWVMFSPLPIAATFLEKFLNFLRRIFSFGIKIAFLSVLIIWFLVNSIVIYPYFLSSFNEIFGGTKNGYQYVVDSNFDWGQDLKRLKEWADKNLGPEEKIAVDYFGGGSPLYYLGNRVQPWQSSFGNPKNEGINWLAISANTIQSAIGQTASGFNRNPVDEYRWLENPRQPADKAGTSIFIYKL
jgi:hypothetical protein